MYYEINVAKLEGKGQQKGYRHFFATAKRSIGSIENCKLVYKELKAAFPEPEYKIAVSRCEKTFYEIDPKTFGN